MDVSATGVLRCTRSRLDHHELIRLNCFNRGALCWQHHVLILVITLTTAMVAGVLSLKQRFLVFIPLHRSSGTVISSIF